MKKMIVVLFVTLLLGGGTAVYGEPFVNPCDTENANTECLFMGQYLAEMVAHLNAASKIPGEEYDVSGFDPENILNSLNPLCSEEYYRTVLKEGSQLDVYWLTSCDGWVKSIRCSDEKCSVATFSMTYILRLRPMKEVDMPILLNI